MITILDELNDCDPTPARLTRVYPVLIGEVSWMERLVERICRNDCSIACTWLLKHHLEQGGELDERLHARVIKTIDTLDHWEARLHILQCLSHLKIPADLGDSLHECIIKLTRDGNGFIRAWAYSGLHHLALQHPRFTASTAHHLNLALTHGNPATKARIRQLMKSSAR